jgi:hypothetical protein
MQRHEFDRSSKWLIQHHGDSLLRMGGAQRVRQWQALQPEVVQPRQWPDGLLEVYFEDREEPDYVLLELATYPDQRIRQQAADDLMLVFQDRRVLPEMLTVILHPRGQVEVTGAHELTSRLGWSRLHSAWRVVELWKLPAEELLAANDIGLIPWLPLTQFTGPAQALVQLCRERIDEQASPDEHANMLAVTQVLTRLRYNDASLLSILGGRKIMIESPLLQELVAESLHETLLGVLEDRCGSVPPETATLIRAILDEKRLQSLTRFAAKCKDLESFQSQLTT